MLLLAAGARTTHPNAARINLSPDEQGDWLQVDNVDGEPAGSVADTVDEGMDNPALSLFYDQYGDHACWLGRQHLHASPYLHEIGAPGTYEQGRWFIDVTAALTP